MTRIRLYRDGGIGRVLLARPEKKNALDRQMADELFAALAQLEGDATIRVIHLAAEGDDFCAGADLEALERTLDAGSEAHRQDAEALGRVFLAIRALMKPVVCTVRGRALAGGAGLATACDLVLAHEGAEFGYPEVRVGFVPAMVMTMLRRAVGEKHAADLVLTGRIINAEEAERIGLVSRVVPAPTYDDEIGATLQQISRSPTTALALTKWLFYKLDSLSFDDGIAAGVVTNVEARSTEDFKRGVRRFPLFPSLKQRAVDGVIGAHLLHQVLNSLDRQVHRGRGLDQVHHAALLPCRVDGQHDTLFRNLVVVLGQGACHSRGSYRYLARKGLDRIEDKKRRGGTPSG